MQPSLDLLGRGTQSAVAPLATGLKNGANIMNSYSPLKIDVSDCYKNTADMSEIISRITPQKSLKIHLPQPS